VERRPQRDRFGNGLVMARLSVGNSWNLRPDAGAGRPYQSLEKRPQGASVHFPVISRTSAHTVLLPMAALTVRGSLEA
jgi:hypothetical protein